MILEHAARLKQRTQPHDEVVRLVLQEGDPLVSAAIREHDDLGAQLVRNRVDELVDLVHVVRRLKLNRTQQLIVQLLRHTIVLVKLVEHEQAFSRFSANLLIVRDDGCKGTRRNREEDDTHDHEYDADDTFERVRAADVTKTDCRHRGNRKVERGCVQLNICLIFEAV